jgi:hypothetical protein
MGDTGGIARLAATYRRFAETDMRGPLAPLRGAGAGPGGGCRHARLPRDAARPKRQPNLLLAAVTHLHGPPRDWADFRAFLAAERDAVRALMLARSTQTNEPGRCAVLLPALARLPQPLALIEVGASAGLCLLPDRYAYDYAGHRVGDAAAPCFPCRANSATPLPRALPEIAWRAGLDLNPLDVNDAEQVAWLETLVWPEQNDRRERLRQAIAVARRDPPRVRRGDLRTALPALAAEAPRGATLVVFHTAVLAYVTDTEAREAFAAHVRKLGARWIANETPRTFPAIAAKAPQPWPTGRFLLSIDGAPVAWTDPHGAAIDWFATAPQRQ